MNFGSFLSDVIATVTGGAVLTFLFFFFKEKIFPPPDVVGYWHVQLTTGSSAYNPYRGMVLRFVAAVWTDGSQVFGTMEKVFESSVNGDREFVGVHRKRSVITGAIQKNYVTADKVLIHAVEDGFSRESTYFHSLQQFGPQLLGSFTTMVADQRGTVVWQREPFV